MTTFADGAPPSVTPEPEDGSGPRDASSETSSGGRARRPDADEVSDTGSSWLRDEIQRRIAEGRTSGSTGRHARHGTPSPTGGAAGYVPRHSVATPGPGAPRPGPVGGQMSAQAGELLRRERTAAAPAWSRPGDAPGGAARVTPVPPAAPAPPTDGSTTPDAPAPPAAAQAEAGQAPASSAAPSTGSSAAPEVPAQDAPAPPAAADDDPSAQATASSGAASSAVASTGPTTGDPTAGDPATGDTAAGGVPSGATGPLRPAPGAPAPADPAPGAAPNETTPIRSTAGAPAPAGKAASGPAAGAAPAAESSATAPMQSAPGGSDAATGPAAAEPLPATERPTAGEPPPVTESQPSRPVRPGVAAAAAVRGAARGRARTAGPPARTAPPAAPANGSTGAPGTAPERAVRGPSTTPAGPNQAATTPQATTPIPPAAPGTAGEEPHGAAVPEDPELTDRTPVVEPRKNGIRVPEQRAGDRSLQALSPRPELVEGGAGDGTEEDEQASRRVRVVLAERKGVARPVRTVVDIQEGTGVGELLRTNLIGSQLAVALRFAVGAGLALGLLPLLFAMAPEIGRIEVLGLRLPWLLLGVLVYPFLFLLGWWHTRTAERVEQNFADHVQD
ncbi:hypothetical protein ACU61A_26555 [Pseudonocardia sichuanensis]